MPWKLVFFLLALILAALFIGFNLDNRCDVSLIFHVFRDVPVFVSLLFAYVAGALGVLPFLFGFLRSRRKRERNSQSSVRTSSRASASPARDANPKGSRNVYDID